MSDCNSTNHQTHHCARELGDLVAPDLLRIEVVCDNRALIEFVTPMGTIGCWITYCPFCNEKIGASTPLN